MRRTPRDNELDVRTEPVGRTFVRSTRVPQVYATLTPLGGTVTALVVHVDGEHPRVPEVKVLGRPGNGGGADVTGEQMLDQAQRLVTEQADYVERERGTIVVETVPVDLLINAGFGLARWPGRYDSKADRARAHKLRQDWADERLEELGARFHDVHARTGTGAYEAWFYLDAPVADRGPRQCPACGAEVRRDGQALADHITHPTGGQCPASGDTISGVDGAFWRTAFGDRLAAVQPDATAGDAPPDEMTDLLTALRRSIDTAQGRDPR